jgi:heme A synthase
MPTKLGNILRSTEDRITPAGGDTEGLMLRSAETVTPRLRRHHDQFRTRLDMYCTLVFIQLVLAGLTLILLVPTTAPLAATLLTTAAFCGLAVLSYSAAIASAQGYCSTLRAIFLTGPDSGT